jgi:hypothetical protein
MRIEADLSTGSAVYKNLLAFNESSLSLKIDGDSIAVNNCFAFPGLVNAHDHLDFSIFPTLLNQRYDNYKSWGADIHQKNKVQIDAALEAPFMIRIQAGIVKNLLNGFTHIIHHGNQHDLIDQIEYPIFLNYRYIHALATESFWKLKLNVPGRKPVMAHIGEGIGSETRSEIDLFLQWNLFRKKLIGIHAIEMTAAQSKGFKAIIWCPESNINLYGKTASVQDLKNNTAILFGTDSPLSASGDHWQQLRNARKLNRLTDEEIFDSLTEVPSRTLGINNLESLVVSRQKTTGWNGFFATDYEDILLVAIYDEVMMIDRSVMHECASADYSLLLVGTREKWIAKKFWNALKELERYPVKFPLNVTLP